MQLNYSKLLTAYTTNFEHIAKTINNTIWSQLNYSKLLTAHTKIFEQKVKTAYNEIRN